MVQEFFAKKSSFSLKTAKLKFFVFNTRVVEAACGTEQPREHPQIERFESSGSQSVFDFFSVRSTRFRPFFICQRGQKKKQENFDH